MREIFPDNSPDWVWRPDDVPEWTPIDPTAARVDGILDWESSLQELFFTAKYEAKDRINQKYSGRELSVAEKREEWDAISQINEIIKMSFSLEIKIRLMKAICPY
jgi:nicotinamide mononucleotide adenylyltransferase